MANFPGPYELEFEVNMGAVVPARTHVIRINCNVVGAPAAGTLINTIVFQKMGGGTGLGQAIIDQAWGFFRLLYSATASCTSVTLWKYVTGTFAKDFISAGSVTTPAGSTGATVTSIQNTLSFRSANGGVMKLVFLETNANYDSSTTLIPNASGNARQRIAAYVMSADNVALARDDGYPVAALRDSGGQNEKVWRKLNR